VVELRVSSTLRLVASCAAAAGLLTVTPAAQGQKAASPSIIVTFSVNGTVTATLNGAPLGSTTGAPTTISAGYYSLVLNGPGDCIYLPLFELVGPGIDLQDDMHGGEIDTHAIPAYFVPNSTYAWHIDSNQAVVYTFKTSGDIVGTPPPGYSPPPTKSVVNPKPTSQDIVGSAVLPFRGTLAGAVSARGTLTLAYRGRSVTSLKAGAYRIAVTDKSSTNGFMLEKVKHTATTITGTAFVGTRSASVDLTAGKWLVMHGPGKTTYSITVLSA
jgi:hypothetical protein